MRRTLPGRNARVSLGGEYGPVYEGATAFDVAPEVVCRAGRAARDVAGERCPRRSRRSATWPAYRPGVTVLPAPMRLRYLSKLVSSAPPSGRIGSPFDLRTLDEPVGWLRQYLARRGVTPPPGSPFSEALAAVERLAQRVRTRPVVPMDDDVFVAMVRDAMGTISMIETLRRSEAWLDTVPTEKLHVLRGPEVNLMRSAASSTERNMAWELFAGAVCARFARGVQLEEPDIRCSFGGSTWGLAAKVLYSDNPQRHLDRIVEGAKQVESPPLPVDIGMVLVNGSSLLPHDDYFRPLRSGKVLSFDDPSVPLRMLDGEAKKFFKGVGTGSLVRRLTWDKKAGVARTKTRLVLLFLQTVTSVRGLLAPMTVCHSLDFGRITAADQDFWRRFDEAAKGAGHAHV